MYTDGETNATDISWVCRSYKVTHVLKTVVETFENGKALGDPQVDGE
jgi:hypothetical protein